VSYLVPHYVLAKEKQFHPFSTEKTLITSLPSKVLEATPTISTNLSGFSPHNYGSEYV
jgi:hypothetical protein